MASLGFLAGLAAECVGVLISGGISGMTGWAFSKLVPMGLFHLVERFIEHVINKSRRSITNG